MEERNIKDLLDGIMTTVAGAIINPEVSIAGTMVANELFEDPKTMEAMYPLFENMGDLLRNLPMKELGELIDVFTKDRELIDEIFDLITEVLTVVPSILAVLGTLSPLFIGRLKDSDEVKKGLITIISGIGPVLGRLPTIVPKITPLITKMSGESKGIKDAIKPILPHLTALVGEIRVIIREHLGFLTGIS